jgi:hypothetical protein
MGTDGTAWNMRMTGSGKNTKPRLCMALSELASIRVEEPSAIANSHID